ncbi:MAG: bifunctional hydroxymethylpyrimidine kinase/phosphomethylpyrimidine kinase [Clostridia bacterium]|nr:bifunctional hydroxymethylpyrimidine kinase/phosphomethylpyrimidine kinase [Clostridia bacterium]
MHSILTITESFDNDMFNVAFDIATVKAFGYEVLPLIMNGCTRLEVASAMNEVYASGNNLPSAVSVGILTDNNVVLGVSERLKRYKAHTIVVDPALISEDGQLLVTEEVYDNLSSKLYPLATIITPNPYELELLTGMEVHSEDDLIKAGRELSIKYRCAVFVKAFNAFGIDLLINGNEFSWIKRNDVPVEKQYSFGTALACMLPECESLEQAATSASQFVYGVIQEKKQVKTSIPFTLNPAPSSMEIRTKTPEPEGVREVPEDLIRVDAPASEIPTKLGDLQVSRVTTSETSSPIPSTPVETDLEVVLSVDNFAPEPVIDETLSRSLKELRDKLNKLRSDE